MRQKVDCSGRERLNMDTRQAEEKVHLLSI